MFISLPIIVFFIVLLILALPSQAEARAYAEAQEPTDKEFFADFTDEDWMAYEGPLSDEEDEDSI